MGSRDLSTLSIDVDEDYYKPSELKFEGAPEVRMNGDESQVTISTGTNSCTVFHAAWLWSNDPTYIHCSSGQRLRSPSTYFSSRARIHSAEIITDASALDVNLPIAPPRGSLHPVGGVYTTTNETSKHCTKASERSRRLLHVAWETNEGNLESLYDLDWLFRCRYDEGALAERQRESEVVKERALSRNGCSLQKLNYHSLLATDNDDARYDLLHAVMEEGAALVTNAQRPRGDAADPSVAIVGKMLAGGSLSHGSLYGDVFHVKTELDANNIAYTSVALSPHQDLSYYESPPGLQLLHCIENCPGVHGGESLLIDALAAAEEFRLLAPDLFDVLVKCDATFLKQRKGADMVYRRPHIQLAASGSNVVSVRWSPPFEGPLAIASHLVDDYFVAYTAFERMIDTALPRLTTNATSARNRLLPMISMSLESELCDYAQAYTWEQRLEPGEIMVFNNQRMLHGRRAFSVSSSADREQRHLMGCYTNIDDTLNEYRILRRQRHHHSRDMPYIWNVGNGSSSMN